MSWGMTKPRKWPVHRVATRSTWASAQSDQCLPCPHEEASHLAHSKDQIGQMPWLTWVLAECTGHYVVLLLKSCTSEQQHDKTNKMICVQRRRISLGICPVWSESSLCTQWVAKDQIFLHADSADSDQTGQMPSLIRIVAGCTCHFVMLRLKSFLQ